MFAEKKKSQNSQEEGGEEVKKPLTQIVKSPRKRNCAKMWKLRKLKGKIHKVNKPQKIWGYLKYLIRNSR